MNLTKHITTDREIKDAFHHAEQAVEALKKAARTIAISGALLLEKKAGMKHGEWLPWLGEMGIGEDKAHRHMNVARAAMGRLEIPHDAEFAGLTFAQTLTLPSNELPPLAQKAREKFEDLVGGKSAQQLMIDWKGTAPAPRYHPQKMPSPAELSKARKMRARHWFANWMGNANVLLNHETLAVDLSREQKEEIMGMNVKVNRFLSGNMSEAEAHVCAEQARKLSEQAA